LNWKFWKRPPSLRLQDNFPTKKKSRFGLLGGRRGATIIAWLASAAFWGLTWGQVLYIAITIISVVYSFVAKGKKPKAASSDIGNSGYLSNLMGQNEPVRVVFGQFRTGGVLVYLGASGTDNEYFHMVLTLSEGPVEGIATDGTGDKIWFFDKRIQDFPSAQWEFFSGTYTQNVCATLQADDPNWNDAMRGTAYLYLKLKYDETLYSQTPQVTVELKGRKIYDPRTDLTAWSRNPALVARDWLTNSDYALGVSSAFLDDDSFTDAANWCDTNTYYFDGAVIERQSVIDNLDDILMNFRGGLIWTGGLYRLLPYDYDTPVMAITEDEIIEDSFSVKVPGIPDTPNRIKITYADAADNYLSKIRVFDDPTAVLSYDLEERDTELELIGTTNTTQVAKLGSYHLERNRLNRQYSFRCAPRAFVLEPMDMIQVTHSLPGWSAEVVRVTDVSFPQDGIVSLTVVEENALLYDDVVNMGAESYFSSTIPNPLAYTSEVQGVDISEELYGTKNNTLTRLLVSFIPPSSGYPAYKEAEIWVSTDGGVNYVKYGGPAWNYAEIDNVTEGTTIYVKVVPITTFNVKRPIASVTAFPHYIQGKTAAPSNVTNIWTVATVGSLIINWDDITDVDLDYYKLRWNPNSDGVWNASIDIGTTYANSITVPLQDGKYFVKAIDTSGNESVDDISFVVDVPDIVGWNVQETLVEDPGFTGSKTDMTLTTGILYLDLGEAVGYYEPASHINLGSIQGSRCSYMIDYIAIDSESLIDDVVDFDLLTTMDGSAQNVGIIPQISLSQNGTDWSDWENFISGNYVAKEIKFRVKAYSTNVNQNLGIETLEFIVDMPDRVEGAGGVVIPNTGDTIVFTKEFMVEPRINLTIEEASAGDYYYLSAISTTQFTVMIKNSGGTGIQKTISWEAKGY